jgi:transposase
LALYQLPYDDKRPVICLDELPFQMLGEKVAPIEIKPGDIKKFLGCSPTTVYNVKHRYQAEGLESALAEKPRSGKPRQISGETCAQITALACSDAPAGHSRWTLRLLADKAIKLGFCDSISHNHVGAILKKTNSART